MSLETVIIIAEFAIIIPLLVRLIVRQVKGQYMGQRRLWGTPIILAVVGLIYLPLTVHTVVPADALLAAVAVAISVAVGLALGALTTAHIVAEPDRRGRRIMIRSGWRGGALWIVFILARLALQPLAASMNAHLVTSAGVVLILIAMARAAMAIIVSPRLGRVPDLAPTAAAQ